MYREQHLQDLAEFSISSTHRPLATSPQLCVVMNAQLLKPSRLLSWLLLASNVDLVPIGEIR